MQDNWTPLLSATRNGHAAIVEALIKAGADVAIGDMVHMLVLRKYWIPGYMLVYVCRVE